MSDEPDYVTVNPAVASGRFNVVIMRYKSVEDGYVVGRISDPLKREHAEALAQSWAAAAKLEIR